MKPVSEGHAGFAVVEHNAANKAGTDCPFEFAQSLKVLRSHRRGRLDFHAGNCTGCPPDHDVHFAAVRIPETEELRRCVVPACLPSQFLKRKRLQKMSQEGPVRRQRLDVGAEQRCGDTGVGEMQSWSLDQPLQAIAVPGWEPFQQEKSLQKRNVVSD